MRRLLHFALFVATLVTAPAFAQTPVPAPGKAPAATAPAAGKVKAIQPGLFEVAGPRVNDVIAAEITSIIATPGKGGRSILVRSPWGDSYYDFPKSVKPVPFSIKVGTPPGGATISAPGFTEANKADYKAAIDAIIPFAISSTKASKSWRTGQTVQ